MITLYLEPETTSEQAIVSYKEAFAANPYNQDINIEGAINIKPNSKTLAEVINYILVNTKVRNLDISNLDFTNEDLLAVKDSLETESTLVSLDIANNYLEDAGIKTLTEILSKNPKIVKCDISDNEITDIGGNYLKEFFSNNKSLKTLKVTHNHITDGTCFLKNNLVFLDADYNKLTTLDAQPHLSTKALWFNFDHNQITYVSKEVLYAFNREEATLDLSDNPLTNDTIAVLGEYEFIKFGE